MTTTTDTLPAALLAEPSPERRRECRNTGAFVNGLIWTVRIVFEATETNVPIHSQANSGVFWAVFWITAAIIIAIGTTQGALIGRYVAKFKHPVMAWIGLNWLCNVGWTLIAHLLGL